MSDLPPAGPLNPPPPRHAAAPPEVQDAAAASLGAALAVSFRVLKLVMLVLLVALLFSGVFTVPANKVAIVLLLGRPIGQTDPDGTIRPAIYPAGLHFALPRPLTERIEIPGPDAEQSIQIEVFWPSIPRDQQGLELDRIRPPAIGLRPGIDGALLTADAGLVHVKMDVVYRIADAAQYFRQLYDDPAINNIDAPPEQPILRDVMEASLIFAAGLCTAEEVLSGQPRVRIVPTDPRGQPTNTTFLELVRLDAERRLAELAIGVELRRVNLTQRTPPLSVRESFNRVGAAENERKELVNRAKGEAISILKGMAGNEYEEILAAIASYDAARTQAPADLTPAQRLEIYNSSGIPELLRRAGGNVSKIIADAERDRRLYAARASRLRKRFEDLLPEYRRDPQLIRERLVLESMRELFARPGAEKIFVTLGDSVQTIWTTPRDPAAAVRRAELEFRKRMQQTTGAAGNRP